MYAMQDIDLKSKNRVAVVVFLWSIPLKLMAVDLYVVFIRSPDSHKLVIKY